MKYLKVFFAFLFYSVGLSINTYSQTPTFGWAKQMDVTASGVAQSIATNSGYVYITGSFGGTADFDPGVGSYNMTASGVEDIFISKLDDSGNFIWAMQFGEIGSYSNKGFSIDIDSLGYIYITGSFGGTVDFDPSAGTYPLTSNNGSIFILKLDGNGSFVWAKQIGGNGNQFAYSLVINDFGHIYLSGYYTGTIDFDPSSNILSATSKGWKDFFVMKMLASSGNLIWAKSFGGSWGDDASSLAVDNDNDNVYVVGNFNDTVDFDPGTGIANLGAGYYSNMFVLKLDSLGNYIWAKKFNASSDYFGRSIGIDINGNSYITGYFDDSTDFDPGPNTFHLVSTTRNAFVLKLSPIGNFVWANHIKSKSPNYGYSLILDQLGNLYTTGTFIDSTFFDLGSGMFSLVSKTNHSPDVYITKYDTLGNLKWVNHIGGDQADNSYAINVDSANNVYTGGNFRSTCDFMSGPGTFNMTAIGISIFIHKLSQCDALDTSVSVNGNTLVSNSVGTSYQWIDCNNPTNILVGDTNQSFTATANGSYAVIVTEKSCSDTSACYNILNVGIPEPDLGTSVALYPNPTDGQFYISFAKAIKSADIEIYDISGKRISEILGFQGNTASLDLMGRPNGIYVVEITTARGRSQVKLVKL